MRTQLIITITHPDSLGTMMVEGAEEMRQEMEAEMTKSLGPLAGMVRIACTVEQLKKP